QTAFSIYPHLQKGQLVVLESTTYPGTTEELVLPILEKSGLRCPIATGQENEDVVCDFYLAFSPEREDPGNKQFGLAQIPKVVGGLNPPSGRAAQALYTQVVARVVAVSSTRAAEMAKLLENIFRCVNIALVHALHRVSRRGQHRHALPRRRSYRQRSQRSQKKHERLENPGPGRGLQKRRGRFARIPFAQNHAALHAARCRARLQRSLLPATPQNAPLQLRAHEVRSPESANARELRCRGHRHRPFHLRLRGHR